MNNIFKVEANNLKSSTDVIKTASILRRLKNKILNLFDSNRRAEVEILLNKTNKIKPLLEETYKKIRTIESAINDLDIKAYENNIPELKLLVSKLDKEINNLNMASEIKENQELNKEDKQLDLVQPTIVPDVLNKPQSNQSSKPSRAGSGRQRADVPEDYIKKYYFKDGKQLETLQEVGQNVGVDIKFGTNIVPTKNLLIPIYSTMAAIMFVGNGPLKDVQSFNKEIVHTPSPEELLSLQQQVSDDTLKSILYEPMPTFKIKKIVGREMRTSGEKKKGTAELLVVPTNAGWIRLPVPLQHFVVRIDFYLVDLGDPTQPGNYKLYRQTVQAVKQI